MQTESQARTPVKSLLCADLGSMQPKRCLGHHLVLALVRVWVQQGRRHLTIHCSSFMSQLILLSTQPKDAFLIQLCPHGGDQPSQVKPGAWDPLLEHFGCRSLTWSEC